MKNRLGTRQRKKCSYLGINRPISEECFEKDPLEEKKNKASIFAVVYLPALHPLQEAFLTALYFPKFGQDFDIVVILPFRKPNPT